MRHSLIMGALFAIVGAVALCGCGGGSEGQGGDSGGATGRQEAKARFVENADALCSRTKREARVAAQAYLRRHEGSGQSRPKLILAAIQAAYLPRIQEQIKKIYALDPPPGEGWQVKAIAVAWKEAILSERRVTDRPHFRLAFAHSASLAQTIGIHACAYTRSGLE